MAKQMNLKVRSFKEEKIIKTKNVIHNGETVDETLNEINIDNYFVSNDDDILLASTSPETGTLSGSKSIVSSAATINIKIYYKTYKDSSGFKYGKLTKTTGSVSGLNSGCKFSKATVVLGSSGLNYTQKQTKTSTNKSWSYNAPSSWKYNIMNTNSGCAIGSKVTAYITRNGTKMYSGTYNVNVS